MEGETGLHPLQIEALRKMTPTQKWEIACSLYDTAKEVKRSFLKGKYPEWSSDQVEAELKRIFLYAST